MRNRGFSLVEVMIAVTIFFGLAGGVMLNAGRARDKAENAAIAGAARTIATDQVAPLLTQFPQNRRWGGARRANRMNGQINLNLRRPGNQNTYDYKNPVSNSGRIRNGGSIGRPAPAVLITNRNRFRYDRLKNRNNLRRRSSGTIIVWLSNNSPDVEVFYVTTDGKLSEYRWNG